MAKADAFYTSKPWRDKREEILERDLWCCRMCGCLLTTGRKSDNSAVVDHIETRAMSPEKELDDDNLWAVCKFHHDSVCASLEARYKKPADLRKAKLNYRVVGLDGYRLRHPND